MRPFPTRVGVSFRQYNKNKPAKYGLLFLSINSTKFPYTYYSTVYSGKPANGDGPYYLTGTDDYVKSIVDGLDSVSSVKGRNITMDCFYTSLHIMLMVTRGEKGHHGGNHSGVGVIKEVTNRDANSTKVFWSEEDSHLTLTSYVVKTKSS